MLCFFITLHEVFMVTEYYIEIRLLASEMKRLRKRWQRTPDPAGKASFNRAACKKLVGVNGCPHGRQPAGQRPRLQDTLRVHREEARSSLPAINGMGGHPLAKPVKKSVSLVERLELPFLQNPSGDPDSMRRSKTRLKSNFSTRSLPNPNSYYRQRLRTGL